MRAIYVKKNVYTIVQLFSVLIVPHSDIQVRSSIFGYSQVRRDRGPADSSGEERKYFMLF